MFLDIAQLIESQGEMVNRIGTVFFNSFLKLFFYYFISLYRTFGKAKFHKILYF